MKIKEELNKKVEQIERELETWENTSISALVKSDAMFQLVKEKAIYSFLLKLAEETEKIKFKLEEHKKEYPEV